MGKEIMLAIGAHPDDLDFVCGGSAALWSREGKEIYFALFTGGDKGGTRNSLVGDELVKTRMGEQRCSSETLGVKEVFFLGRKDGEVVNDLKLREDLVRLIRKVKPDTVLAFDPANRDFDNFRLQHTDHRIGGEAVFDALYPAAKNRLYFPYLVDEGLLPHKTKKAYFFGTYRPNLWIDITSTIEYKIQALLCYKSQLPDDKVLRERVYELAGNCALGFQGEGKTRYMEAFRAIDVPQ